MKEKHFKPANSGNLEFMRPWLASMMRERMNNRQRQINKLILKNIRKEHNAMMKELFDFMDSVFVEIDDEMEDK